MPLTKEQKKEYDKKYREANKERRKEQKKEYYEQNKQTLNEQMRQYREQNKQKLNEQKKEYYQQNKEQKKEYDKIYREQNKEKIKEQMKEYIQTENGKKSYRISHWKSNGVISDDFNALYDKYINTNECELCNVAITCGRGLIGKKHLDHCHITGQFRNILCGDCNINVMKNK